MPQTISANQFKSLLESNQSIDLIDVRTPVEYQEIHIIGARNVPLDRLDPHAVQAGRNGTAHTPLYIVCRSGARGSQACQKFVAAGLTNVINVEGGTMACAAAGVSVVRGVRKAIPLNCQVQLVTGSLVVLGAALAYWVHPIWSLLPAIMGAGLMFSGATNTCAMGVCLAKMPWNQVKSA